MNFTHSLVGAPLAALILLFGQPTQDQQDKQNKKGHNGLNYLGHGYNLLNPDKQVSAFTIINESAKANEIRSSDIGPLSTLYKYNTGESLKSNSYEATSISSFKRQRSLEASTEGEYLGVSGKAEAQFSSSAQRETEYHLKMKSVFQISGVLFFDDSGDSDVLKTIKDSLKTNVKTMLNDPTVPPAKFFEEHGTHVLTKVYMGGKVDFYYESSDVKTITSKDFSAAVELKYDGAATGSAAVKVTDKESGRTSDVSVTSKATALGGKTSAIRLNAQSGDLDDWRATVPDQPTYVGYPDNGLMPLWKLCTDPKRGAQIEAAFKRQRAINKLKNPAFFTKTTTFISGHGRVVKGEFKLADLPQKNASTNYKILSGGAQILAPTLAAKGGGTYLLMRDSYPTEQHTWTAQFESRVDYDWESEVKMQINVVAIYDPENDWDVKTFDVKTLAALNSPSAPNTNTIVSSSGYKVTGGGVQLNYETTNERYTDVVVSSHPLSDRAWSVLSRPYGHNVTKYPRGLINTCIAIKPANGLDILLESQIKTASGELGKYSTATYSATDGYTLVGGGAQGVADSHYLFGSYPSLRPDGTLAWTGLSGVYFLRDPDYYGKAARATVYGIGLLAR